MDQWYGKVAMVTGANGGIGSVLVENLFKSGIKVIGCDYNVDILNVISKNLKDERGELYTIQCDLRKEDEILSMFDEIKQKYGGVDILVNAAGIYRHTSNITSETEKWREIFEVNVLALSICTREAIKSMKERKVPGHIVHIGSNAGHHNSPDLCMYTASKHAVRSLTESLMVELRQEKSNIRISSVSSGPVKTNMAKAVIGEETFKQLGEMENHILLPEDVASAVVYMLSCPPRVQVHDIIIRAAQYGNTQTGTLTY